MERWSLVNVEETRLIASVLGNRRVGETGRFTGEWAYGRDAINRRAVLSEKVSAD
ncbi:MAG: hypothetical protein SFY66_26100 [Oculatellaceae cyanobacterium bins.114]|nr:hypothetical protein [Oculatellaceae cyanobacterium bins.114]